MCKVSWQSLIQAHRLLAAQKRTLIYCFHKSGIVRVPGMFPGRCGLNRDHMQLRQKQRVFRSTKVKVTYRTILLPRLSPNVCTKHSVKSFHPHILKGEPAGNEANSTNCHICFFCIFLCIYIPNRISACNLSHFDTIYH